MNVLLKDYHSISRIGIVIKDADFAGWDPILSRKHECFVLTPNHISFTSDGYSVAIDGEFAQRSCGSLNTGDIVIINEAGLLSQIYDCHGDEASVYLTGHCNSNCVMCPSSDAERRNYTGMTDDWMLEYLSLLPEDVGHIVVTGGEPTLNTAQFFLVMAQLAAKYPDTEVLLLTNGRSFASVDMANELTACCPLNLKVAIPIHGNNAELHDLITQASGSFEQSLAGIEHLQNRGIRIELRVVVSQLNVNVLSTISELIVSRFSKVDVVNFVGLEARGNCAKNYSEVYIDHRVAFAYIKPAVDNLISHGIAVGIYNFPLCAIDKGYWTICRSSISQPKIRFTADCSDCEAKSICGGFFATTLSLAKPKVFPVHFFDTPEAADEKSL